MMRLAATWLLLLLSLTACVAPAARVSPPNLDKASIVDMTSSTCPIGPLNPDRSCKMDADCAVKNVGGCFSDVETCVNKDARTDPAAVRDECRRLDMIGNRNIAPASGCSCVQNTCRDIDASYLPKTH